MFSRIYYLILFLFFYVKKLLCSFCKKNIEIIDIKRKENYSLIYYKYKDNLCILGSLSDSEIPDEILIFASKHRSSGFIEENDLQERLMMLSTVHVNKNLALVKGIMKEWISAEPFSVNYFEDENFHSININKIDNHFIHI